MLTNKIQIFTLAALLFSFSGAGQTMGELTIHSGSGQSISKNIYGHFSEDLGRCIYDGFWVDSSLPVPKQDRIRLDVVDALKKINIPVLRWPGGCFADQYHWRDGIGPVQDRPRTVNTTWGMVPDDNSFGTHEFLKLCELLHCEPYIAGNVGTGAPQEMENWLEYLNFSGESTLTALRKKNGRDKAWKVSFWGVGNESWGCGGNMTPAFYAEQYRRYAEFTKDYPGAPLKLIASGANSDDYEWTETVMKNIPLSHTWGISLHYYTLVGNWEHKGSATQFTEEEYFKGLKNCLKIEEIVRKHSAIMDKYDAAKKVGLVVDEWGIWTDAEPGTNPSFLFQQNSLRDALIAATTLNIFNNHCDRVKMANLAQTVNVLQALVLTNKEKMVLTPTYFVFDMYKIHQDAKLLPMEIKSPDYEWQGQRIPGINVSASQGPQGIIHISLVNLDAHKQTKIRTILQGVSWEKITQAQILTARRANDCNTFENPLVVKPEIFQGAKKNGNELTVELPPLSVVVLELR